MKRWAELLNDAIFCGGIVLIGCGTAGIWSTYVACIVIGSILVASIVLGRIRP